jgi:hypothetical protein
MVDKMSLTETEAELLKYLENLGSFCQIHGGFTLQEFVLKYGRFFKYKELPPQYKRGVIKECYSNAGQLALFNRDLTYVEGYAYGAVIPVLHAWCVNSNGEVIDNTWQSGQAYFGIPFQTKYLIKSLSKYQTYGLIDKWEVGYPILKEKPEKFLKNGLK